MSSKDKHASSFPFFFFIAYFGGQLILLPMFSLKQGAGYFFLIDIPDIVLILYVIVLHYSLLQRKPNGFSNSENYIFKKTYNAFIIVIEI